jgi:hypothetical protein
MSGARGEDVAAYILLAFVGVIFLLCILVLRGDIPKRD